MDTCICIGLHLVPGCAVGRGRLLASCATTAAGRHRSCENYAGGEGGLSLSQCRLIGARRKIVLTNSSASSGRPWLVLREQVLVVVPLVEEFYDDD